MKFQINKLELLENIQISSKAVTSKSTMPILDCILLKVENNMLTLFSTDISVGIITAAIKVDMLDDGADSNSNMPIALEARMFQEIIRRMPDGNIFFEYDSNFRTIIHKDKISFTIIGRNGNEFPEIPTVDREYCYKIPSIYFNHMIRQTVFAVSTDENRAVFTGELLNIYDNILTIVAVDGYRIALRKYYFEEDDIPDLNIVVLGKTLNELSKLLQNSSDDDFINIYVSNENVLFETPEFTLVSNLIEGEFLKYEQSFDIETSSSVIVDTKDLLKSVECAVLFCNTTDRDYLIMKIENQTINLSITSANNAFNDELNVSVEGDDLSIAFDPKSLTEILRVIDEEEITLNFTTNTNPLIIKPYSNDEEKEDDSYKYLILPIRQKKND